MKTSNTKRVKAYAVLYVITNDRNGKTVTDLEYGDMIERYADCACNAAYYKAPAVFEKRKYADAYKGTFDVVVPCTIEYTLPHKKQKK